MFVGRAKRDIGLSFVGVLVTDREAQRRRRVTTASSAPISSGGPSARDVVTGQWLYSDTQTPNRPDLADEWTGQSLTRQRRSRPTGTTTRGISTGPPKYKDVGDGFRADTGFVPQVGYREGLRADRLDGPPDRLLSRACGRS